MVDTEQLIENIARDAKPVKRAPHPFKLSAWWLIGATLYLAVTLIFFRLRPDLLLKFQSPLFLAEIVLLVGIVMTASMSAALLAFPDMHQKRWLAVTPIFVGLLFILTMGCAWYADNPASPPPLHNIKCTAEIAILALLPVAWIFFSMRGLASTHPYLTGGTALLFAFGIGALSLRLVEQTDSIAHVVLWHYLPMVAAVVLGLWIGKKLLKW